MRSLQQRRFLLLLFGSSGGKQWQSPRAPSRYGGTLFTAATSSSPASSGSASTAAAAATTGKAPAAAAAAAKAAAAAAASKRTAAAVRAAKVKRTLAAVTPAAVVKAAAIAVTTRTAAFTPTSADEIATASRIDASAAYNYKLRALCCLSHSAAAGLLSDFWRLSLPAKTSSSRLFSTANNALSRQQLPFSGTVEKEGQGKTLNACVATGGHASKTAAAAFASFNAASLSTPNFPAKTAAAAEPAAASSSTLLPSLANTAPAAASAAVAPLLPETAAAAHPAAAAAFPPYTGKALPPLTNSIERTAGAGTAGSPPPLIQSESSLSCSSLAADPYTHAATPIYQGAPAAATRGAAPTTKAAAAVSEAATTTDFAAAAAAAAPEKGTALYQPQSQHDYIYPPPYAAPVAAAAAPPPAADIISAAGASPPPPPLFAAASAAAPPPRGLYYMSRQQQQGATAAAAADYPRFSALQSAGEGGGDTPAPAAAAQGAAVSHVENNAATFYGSGEWDGGGHAFPYGNGEAAAVSAAGGWSSPQQQQQQHATGFTSSSSCSTTTAAAARRGGGGGLDQMPAGFNSGEGWEDSRNIYKSNVHPSFPDHSSTSFSPPPSSSSSSFAPSAPHTLPGRLRSLSRPAAAATWRQEGSSSHGSLLPLQQQQRRVGARRQQQQHSFAGSHLVDIEWQQETLIPIRKNFYREAATVAARTAEEVEAILREHHMHVELGHSSKSTGSGSRYSRNSSSSNSSSNNSSSVGIPKPVLSFEEAGFPPGILQQLTERMQLQHPTAIQKIGWPVALSGRDMIGIAQTGSGKTLGFLLPGLVHAAAQPPLQPGGGPIVLVLAPTRELVMQIRHECHRFTQRGEEGMALTEAAAAPGAAGEEGANAPAAAGGPGADEEKHTGWGAGEKRPRVFRTACVYGGVPRQGQAADLRRGAEILVATPGRLLDFLDIGVTNLKRVSYVVLDEADRMMDMGFEPQVRKLFSQIRPDRQTLLWSATWPKEVRELANEFCKGHVVKLQVGDADLQANANVTQRIEVVSPGQLQQRLLDVLQQIKGNKTLIFCETKRQCDQLCRELRYRQMRALAIHGDKEQRERDRILHDFRVGHCEILVATDVASRGLDIKDVRFVINYELPKNIESYIHRIGRTGRAGNKGTAISFFEYEYFQPEKVNMAKRICDIMRAVGQHPPQDLVKIARS